VIANSPSAVAQAIGPLRTVVRADEVPVKNPRRYPLGLSILNEYCLKIVDMIGAEGGIRTLTGLLPTDFKSVRRRLT
jgi:hypothetical protein